MEPIVLLGAVIVVYAGYVSLEELLRDSVLLARFMSLWAGARRVVLRKPRIESPVKKMAGMHV